MDRKRSPLIWCAKKVTLPENLRDEPGTVNIHCYKQEDEDGNVIPGSVGVRAHGFKHSHEGFHNICESKICVHNTLLRPPNRPNIFSSFAFLSGDED